ncbi:MAG TPA: hypothetical protein PLB11_12640 [Flavobacterium sp.]|nr:hypothetical protein [Flavobacterium sp.]
MNIVNPTTLLHKIIIIPRYYPTGIVKFSLYNETTQLTDIVTVVYNVVDGKMFIDFDYDFIENQSFKVKITENDNVVYMGKLFVTSQEPQSYKITQNVYYK